MSSAPTLPPKQGTDQQDSGILGDSEELPSFKLDRLSVPNYLESLPIKHLKDLISNHELLKDYIMDQNKDKLDLFKADILKQVDNNIEMLTELQVQFSNEILPKQEILMKELSDLNKKFKEVWSIHELEMYQLLNKYSNENLIKHMTVLVLEVDDISNSLYQSLLSKDKVTDNELTKFVEDYMGSRQLYHLRKEKLYRLKENRVSG